MNFAQLFRYDATGVEDSIRHWVDTEYFDGTSDLWGYADQSQLSLRVESGIGNLVSSPGCKIEYFGSLKKGTLQKAFSDQASIVQDFLQHGKLPKKPSLARGDWKALHFHSLVQISLLYCVMRLGNNTAQSAFIDLLTNDCPREVNACFIFLWFIQSDDFQPLPTNVLDAFQAVAMRYDGQPEAVASIAENNGQVALVPRLLALADSSPTEVALSIKCSVLALLPEQHSRLQICQQTIPTLSYAELSRFVHLITREPKIDDITKAIVVDQAFEQMNDLELLELLGDWRISVLSLLRPDHAARLRTLTNIEPRNDIQVEGQRKVSQLLAAIEPVRDVRLLFKDSDFDYIAGTLLGTLQPSEVDAVLKAAQSKSQLIHYGFGESSVLLFWKECGDVGRQYLRENLERINYESCVTLLNLVNKLTAPNLAEWLVELGLCSAKTKTAILDNARFAAMRGIGAIVREMMTTLNRCCCCDGESGEIPPNYDYLVRAFCDGSNGKLDVDVVSITACDASDETAGYHVTLRWKDGTITNFNTDYSGDWYDHRSVAKHLNEVAKRRKLRDRFCSAMGDGQSLVYYFGPPKKIEQLIARTSTSHPPTTDGCAALRDQIKTLLESLD